MKSSHRRRTHPVALPSYIPTTMASILPILVTLPPSNVAAALFESKKKREARLAAERAAVEAARLSKLFVVGGLELDRRWVYAGLSTLVVVLIALFVQFQVKRAQLEEEEKEEAKRNNRNIIRGDAASSQKDNGTGKTLDVVVVGCGLPKANIGWFHLVQLQQMPNVRIRAVIEPYYLDRDRCPHPPNSFVDFMGTLVDMDIPCHCHVTQLEAFRRPTLCILSGRTSENPIFFRECLGLGATHIYLEPPGAPTVSQLREMKTLADARGVRVYMGYQTLAAKYVERAVALSQSIPNSHAFFCHNDTHRSADLHKLFFRYPEGLLRSMASYDLAILVSQYHVTADAIDKFKVNTNRLFSERKIFRNEARGTELADYSRVAFKITTRKGLNVSVMADRCGGLVSFAVVKNQKGEEIRRFESHDESEVSNIRRQIKEDTEMNRQFIVQAEDFLELKTRIVKGILSGKDGGGVGELGNVVGIGEGIDVLILADYCTKEIDAVLKPSDGA
ncbi:hypothetical protein ACHAXS_010457 [Conticribra weissflogii]